VSQIHSAWKPPGEQPVLPPEEVHVWAILLDLDDAAIERLHGVLSQEERSRAAAIRLSRQKKRFVAGRGALRSILAGYARSDPARLEFRYNRWGKPELTAGGDLQFNLTHSGALGLCAVTRGRAVGVDVERVRQRYGQERIAERFFSQRERRELRDLPAAARPEAFCRLWTRLEAYQKAKGESIFGAPHPEPVKGSVHGHAREATEVWDFCDLAPAAGYVGAVIAGGNDWRLVCWTWSPSPPGCASHSGS
jgi:4'-phosphopantetheinyl transferase